MTLSTVNHPQAVSHRAVWKIMDGDTQTFDMYGAHHGGKETKIFEIAYTRKR
jgi:hypothetical protein